MKAQSLLKPLAALAGAAALLLGAGAAQAHGDNIYWSIGVGSPGVHVGVASAPPVVMYPPVVYMPPRPVIYAPVAPVMYGPPPGWRHHHRGWERGHGYREHEREGRWDGGHREGWRR